MSAEKKKSGIHSTGMIDLEHATHVEVEVDAESKLWINVDGVCRLRIGKVENIHTKLHNFLKKD